MTEIQGESILVRVSARFELSGVDCTWHQLTQLANGTWDTIAWIMNFCTTLIVLLTGAVSERHAKYFKSK